jgi:hypothetical protein
VGTIALKNAEFRRLCGQLVKAQALETDHIELRSVSILFDFHRALQMSPDALKKTEMFGASALTSRPAMANDALLAPEWAFFVGLPVMMHAQP